MSDTEIQGPEQGSSEGTERKTSDTFADALKAMISFFTIIRVDVGEKETEAMEKNFWLAPVLGLLVGMVGFMVCFVLGFIDAGGTVVLAAAALATPLIFSKFLHLDGLVDFGDGITVSSPDREVRVRALKDTLIGAGGFGVALVTLLVSFACYIELPILTQGAWIGDSEVIFRAETAAGMALIVLMVEVLVKNAQVAAAAYGTAGTGMAARQVDGTDMDSLMKSTMVTAAIVAAVTLAAYSAFDSSSSMILGLGLGAVIVACLISVLMSVFVGWFMARAANRTFGFVNGDILGATNEVARAVILLVTVLTFGIIT